MCWAVQGPYTLHEVPDIKTRVSLPAMPPVASAAFHSPKTYPHKGNQRVARALCRMPWALTAVAWVQSALPEEHPQPVPVTDCNDVACVAASNAGESHRQTRIGAILAAGIHDESPQYICADDSKRTRCPRVAAQLGASLLNLTIPSHARWLFEGPSYTQEIYDTLVAANGGCRSSRGGRLSTSEAAVLTPPHAHWRPRGNSGDGVDTKGPTYDHSDACHLANGAVVAYLNGELVRGFVRKHAWTHGFFMQPHNKKYRIEHERAAAEGDEVDEKAFADTQVCRAGLEPRTSRLRARAQPAYTPQRSRHGCCSHVGAPPWAGQGHVPAPGGHLRGRHVPGQPVDLWRLRRVHAGPFGELGQARQSYKLHPRRL